MLSRFVITFLPRNKHLLISWLQSLFAVILELKKIYSATVPIFPIYLPWSDVPSLGKQWQTLFSWAPKSLQMVTSAMKLKDACFLEEKLWASRQHIKKQRHYFADNGPSSQSYDFSGSHLSMWELGHKESWALKNWCFWTVVLKKTLESTLDNKEFQPVHPKGNQS